MIILFQSIDLSSERSNTGALAQYFESDFFKREVQAKVRLTLHR